MDAPKLELFLYLPNGRTEVVRLPDHLAAELCRDQDFPTFPSFPSIVALSTTREGGCGVTVGYARAPTEDCHARADPPPGAGGAKPRRPRGKPDGG